MLAWSGGDCTTRAELEVGFGGHCAELSELDWCWLLWLNLTSVSG